MDVNALFLTLPDVKYRDTFLDALREYHAEGRHLDLNYVAVARDFEGFVRRRLDRAHAERIPASWVPETYFWLIDGETYIGTTRLRHYLTPSLRKYGGHIGYEIRPSKRRQGYGTQILRLALQEARKRGIERALVTCDRENTGSRKIIEANGGVFEGEDVVWVGSQPIHERRYWVDTGLRDEENEG